LYSDKKKVKVNDFYISSRWCISYEGDTYYSYGEVHDTIGPHVTGHNLKHALPPMTVMDDEWSEKSDDTVKKKKKKKKMTQ
jgi:hypothetical protein